MPKRGENIHKRKDGRWEARYIHHYENGKAKYRFIYGHSYSEAKTKMLSELSSVRSVVPSLCKNTTFSEIADKWLSEIKNTVKESTFARYHRAVKKYIVLALGQKKVCKLDKNAVTAFAMSLTEHGGKDGRPLSCKTVSDIMSIFRHTWEFGRKNGYPCSDIGEITIAGGRKRKIKTLPESAVKIIEKEMQQRGSNIAMCIVLTLFTGLRIGELCGLRWEDIDFDNGILHVRRTIERIADLSSVTKRKTKIIISAPKTETSVRDIPLPVFLLDYLSMFRCTGECYLLTGSKSFIEPNRCYKRYKRYLAEKGLGDYTFHALRHTFATRCVESGFDTKSLSELLGHSNVRTTLSFYVHPTMEMKRRQMMLLAPVFTFNSSQNCSQAVVTNGLTSAFAAVSQ